MIIKAVNENRLLKTIISIILCLTVTAFTIMIKCVEVYAIALALPLIGAGLLIAAGILVMAGLTFESEDQATIASNQWFIDLCSNHKFGSFIQAKTEFTEMCETSEEVKVITDDVWNYTKTWVSEWYDEGENNINRDLYTVVDDEGNYIEYCLDPNDPYDHVLRGSTIDWFGEVYEWIYEGESTIFGDIRYIYRLYRNGLFIKELYTQNQEGPQFYIYADANDKLRLAYKYDNKKMLLSYSEAYEKSGYEDQIQMARSISEDLEYNIAAIGAVDVVDNQEFDYETADENRSVYVPSEGTIEDYVGLTHDELKTITNTAIAGEPVPDTETRTWWENLFGGVSAKVEEGAQLLVGTLADLKAWLDGTYQNLIDSVNTSAASIEDAIEAQQEEDIEPKMQQFRLPSLFILFLDVLLACIRLIIRACVYLATIVGIEPDGSLLNNDTKSGLDFFRNQVIPVINISIWDMYSGLMTLVISMAVVKRVRRTVE